MYIYIIVKRRYHVSRWCRGSWLVFAEEIVHVRMLAKRTISGISAMEMNLPYNLF